MTASTSIQDGFALDAAARRPAADGWQRDMEKSQADEWFASCLFAAREESPRQSWLRAEMKVEADDVTRSPDAGGFQREAQRSSPWPMPVETHARSLMAPQALRTSPDRDGALRSFDAVPGAWERPVGPGDSGTSTTALSSPRADVATRVFGTNEIGPGPLEARTVAPSRMVTWMPGPDRGAGANANRVDPMYAPAISPPASLGRSGPRPIEAGASQVIRQGAKVRAVEPVRAEKASAPMRVTACWNDQGVSIWVGADASALAHLAEISHALRQRFATLGVRVVSLTCNGRAVTYESNLVPTSEHTREGGSHGD